MKFVVTLFLRQTEGTIQKERLQSSIIEANNADEALGLYIRSKRDWSDYPIIYWTVVHVPLTESNTAL